VAPSAPPARLSPILVIGGRTTLISPFGATIGTAGAALYQPAVITLFDENSKAGVLTAGDRRTRVQSRSPTRSP